MLKTLMMHYCQSVEMLCHGTITKFGPRHIAITDLELDAKRGPNHLEVDSVSLELSWDGLFQPSIASVNFNNPTITLALNDTLFGQGTALEPGSLAQRGPDHSIPDIQIENGKLRLLTLAGPLDADFAVQLAASGDGTASVRIAPTQLSLLDQHLTISTATARFARLENRPQIEIDLAITDLELGDVSAAQLAVSMASDQTAPAALAWTLNADHISNGDRINVKDIALSGRAGWHGDENEPTDILTAITPVSLSGTTGAITTQHVETSSTKLDGAIIAKAESDDVEISLQVAASDLLAATVTAEHATLSFLGGLARPDNAISGHGNFNLDIINFGSGAEHLQPSLAPYLAAILTPHDDALAVSDIIVDGLSIESPYRFQRDEQADWQLTFPDPVSIRLKPHARHDARPIDAGATKLIRRRPNFAINRHGLVQLNPERPARP